LKRLTDAAEIGFSSLFGLQRSWRETVLSNNAQYFMFYSCSELLTCINGRLLCRFSNNMCSIPSIIV